MKLVTVICPECRKPNLIDPSLTSELVCSHCKEKTLVVATGALGSLTGAILGENYAVEERIGQGGFGEVYRARDQLLQRPVAIKVLAHPTDLDAERSGKFLREAVTAARITHPNVVHVYDVGTDRDRGVHYLVMEFVEGRDLKERVEAEGPMGEDEATAMGLQIARGLAAAHARGIVHRDIKPGNIMETLEGGVKITDFGLAKILQVDHVTKTQTAGSVAYMPPEQFEGRVVDERADLYALGATLYFLLSGKTPYPGAHDFNVMYNILSREPTPLGDVAPQVSPELAELIGLLIQKDPDKRPSGAQEVIETLEGLLGRTRSSIHPCPSCGALNGAGQTFCSGCGKSLDAGAAPRRPGAARLPEPPKETEPRPAAAKGSGPVADDDRTVMSAPKEPRKAGPLLSWKGWAAVLLIGGGLGALAIFGGDLLSPGTDGGPPGNGENGTGGGPTATGTSPPIPITPEGADLLRRGDFEGYLARGEKPLAAPAREVAKSRGQGYTFFDRMILFDYEATALGKGGRERRRPGHDDEAAQAAFLEGLAVMAIAVIADKLDRIAGMKPPREVERLLSYVKETTLRLKDGPLWKGVSSAYDAAAALQALNRHWKKGELVEPYVDHYDRLDGVHRDVEAAEAACKAIGADPAAWKDLAKRTIRDRHVFPALLEFVPGVEADEKLYRDVIPHLEVMAELGGRSLEETFSEMVEAAAGKIPIPWE